MQRLIIAQCSHVPVCVHQQPWLIGPYVLVAAPVQTHSRVQWPVVRMQHSQACSGTGYSASEPAHSTPNHRLQSMLKTLIPELQTCADILLDSNVWNDEEKWKNKNADKFKDYDFVGPFWNVSVDHKASVDEIAIFHKSLKNIVKIIVDAIQYQKDSQAQDTSDRTSKHTDQWGSLKKYLTDLELTLHEHVRNPSNARIPNVVTFSMLTHKTTWENWIEGCIDDARLYNIWHFFAQRMANFCSFFVDILQDLSTNEEHWPTYVEKILYFCREVARNTHILDKLRKVDNMAETDIRTFVTNIQNTLEIPFWLRIDAKKLELKKVKTFAKDLLIAPSTRELKKLYKKGNLRALIMCIHAMEDQNNIAESDRAEINNSLLRDEEKLMLYARKYNPSPIFADLENMNRGTLEATVIRMLRDLCMLPTKRPNLEEFSDDKLVSYGETLLAKYPCEKFPSRHDHIDRELIKRLASTVHLPEDDLQTILKMPTKTIHDFYRRYDEVEKLKSSYPEISFYSITASQLGVTLWSGLKAHTISLQTGFCNNADEGILDLTICRYNQKHSLEPRDMDVSFLLTTKSVGGETKRSNVTQFMQLTFGYEDLHGKLYCLLYVHDPATETDGRKQNSKIMHSYAIPYTHTREPTNNQKAKLLYFLDECATKIGQPVPRETINQSLNRQLYRACDAKRRMERPTRSVPTKHTD